MDAEFDSDPVYGDNDKHLVQGKNLPKENA